MKPRATILCTCLAIATASAAFGQAPAATGAKKDGASSASSAAPSVDKIIAHYVAAVGGPEAWQKLNSRVSMGTIEIPSANVRGTVVIHEKAPNKILTIIIVEGSAFREGYDGKTGWSEDAQSGVREQAGAELAETRRQADFYSPLNVHQHYSKLTLVGSEKINDRNTYVLEGTLAEGGPPDKMFFDADTGLPVRLISQHHSEEAVAQLQEDFSDYRQVDGVMLPFEIAQKGGNTPFVVKIGEVRHNVELEDGEFSEPAVQ